MMTERDDTRCRNIVWRGGWVLCGKPAVKVAMIRTSPWMTEQRPLCKRCLKALTKETDDG